MDIQPQVFILGCPRSGTSLLAALLEAHFGVVGPVEPHFLPYFHPWRNYWGDLKHSDNRSRLLDAIFGFSELWVPRNNPGQDLQKITPQSLLSLKAERDDIINQSHDYSSLCHAVFSKFSHQNGGQGWVDKSAYYDPMQLSYILDVFPQARIIHIVRDGRDTAMSWQKTWFHPSSLSEGMWLWKKHSTHYHEFCLQHPENTIEIRYEDLLENISEIMGSLERFLGTTKKKEVQALTDTSLGKALSINPTHQLMQKGVVKTNKEKWRTQMPQTTIHQLENIAQKELLQWGYPITPKQTDKSTPTNATTPLFLWKRYLLLANYKRWAKWAIPPVLMIVQRFMVKRPKY
ncbi:sulfotransferase family protein [Magnetococcus sp. PR-3]|uniref:sulfotransferase family protein n=1 Tax=Magnetococcus sp. PR-3 TaxID=3120355 RepID=UPI002FCDE8F3